MPTPSEAEKTATVAYWNSLIEINKDGIDSMKELVAALNPDAEDLNGFVTNLTNFAAGCARLNEKYNAAVGALPVLHVDQRLCDETARDIRQGAQIMQHVSGLAEAAADYAAWIQRTQNRSAGDFWNDLLDSFVMGLQGQPFAGYNNMKKKAATLDSEGGEYARRYMSHLEALSASSHEAQAEKAREIELRSFLSRKYSVEFPAMPELED